MGCFPRLDFVVLAGRFGLILLWQPIVTAIVARLVAPDKRSC
jgi:hypothetical protein